MQRHKRYLHLVAANVREDFIGSLVIEVDSKYGYLQFEHDINYFWEQCLGKTSKTIKETKAMLISGFKQEVWINEEYLDAVLTCNAASVLTNRALL